MKSTMKKILMATMMVATLTLGMSVVSFAAEGWQKNDIGWWYATNDAETTWYANGWYWIDGNNDGIAECYLFNADGYMYADCVTPDGYTVDANGAWTVDGKVKTIYVGENGNGTGSSGNSGSGSSTSTGNSGTGSSSSSETAAMTKDEIIAQGYNEYGISNVAMDMINNTREENKKYGEVDSFEGNDGLGHGATVYYNNGYMVTYYDHITDYIDQLVGDKAFFVHATDPALIIKDADESISKDSAKRTALLKEYGLNGIIDQGDITFGNFDEFLIRWYEPTDIKYYVILSRG